VGIVDSGLETDHPRLLGRAVQSVAVELVDGDLVVVVPDADVLFTGDLLESAGPPSFGTDSVPDEWPATLDAVIGLMTATTLAIPGHGEPVDREFVFEQRGWIAAQAAQRGTPPGPTLPLV